MKGREERRGFVQGRAYRKVVEVRQEIQHADEGDETEEDAAHRRTTSRGLVDLTPPIASKRRKGHEAASNDVGYAKRDELSVRRQGHTLNSFSGLGISNSERFGSNRGLKEA